MHLHSKTTHEHAGAEGYRATWTMSGVISRPILPQSPRQVFCCVNLLPCSDSVAFFDDPDRLHASLVLRANLAGSTVDGAAKSGQGCLNLRHAERLELLHRKVAVLQLRVLVPLRHPTVVSSVVADAWDRALLGLDHGLQVFFIEVDLVLHVGDHLLIARGNSSTKGGKRRGVLRHAFLLELADGMRRKLCFLILVPVSTPSAAFAVKVDPWQPTLLGLRNTRQLRLGDRHMQRPVLFVADTV